MIVTDDDDDPDANDAGDEGLVLMMPTDRSMYSRI